MMGLCPSGCLALLIIMLKFYVFVCIAEINILLLLCGIFLKFISVGPFNLALSPCSPSFKEPFTAICGPFIP